MSRLISKHGYTADKIKKIKVAEEVEFLDEGTGTIKVLEMIKKNLTCIFS